MKAMQYADMVDDS